MSWKWVVCRFVINTVFSLESPTRQLRCNFSPLVLLSGSVFMLSTATLAAFPSLAWVGEEMLEHLKFQTLSHSHLCFNILFCLALPGLSHHVFIFYLSICTVQKPPASSHFLNRCSNIYCNMLILMKIQDLRKKTRFGTILMSLKDHLCTSTQPQLS